ncbi:alpha-glucan water dikinase, chloroplast precursor [Dorcoceras hygrometricum]|uniref:Alpha-glucan water dikinase, chloroplast n=1 Tax=Dorcoceras hygrometricum TaxID=472368 RepID=A0A2Z7CNN5_9LAMI|nr:alpha-glucan water dikinase, chloroplast precursor [Dorcoceras hygrometricum]
MGSNPSTESNYKTAVNSMNTMQMLCMRCGTTAEGYNQGREPKNAMHSEICNRISVWPREMRVRNHRSPSHPGTTEQQQRNKAMAATAERNDMRVCNILEYKRINICNTAIKHNKHTQSSTRTSTRHGHPINQQPQFIQAINMLIYKLQIRTSIPSTISTITGPRDLIPTPANTRKVQGTLTETHGWESHTQTSYHPTQQLNRKL